MAANTPDPAVFSPVTKGNMIAEILSDTERGEGETEAIRSKIAAAIRHYQPTRFWFNESRDATFSTVVDQADYAFRSDISPEFYRIDGVFLTDGGNVIPLERADYQKLEVLLDGGAGSGAPMTYAYVDRQLRIYPYPDAVYSVRVTGHVKIANTTSDDEEGNEWFNEAYDLIMSRAKAELYAHRWEDPVNAQIMRAAESDALKRLLGATTDKVAPGYLELTEF